MSKIVLQAEDVRALADKLGQSADATEIEKNTMRPRLEAIGDTFQGQTATAFDGTFAEWESGCQQVIESLRSLGKFLTTAANTMEETDAQIAAQLRS